MKLIKYISLGVMLIGMAACQENETMLFDSEFNTLNFKLKRDDGLGPDSLYVNFMFLPDAVSSEVTKVKLRLMGMPMDKDRYYKVMAVADESTAEEGVHYAEFQDQYLFPSGETEINFELESLREASMKEKTYRLVVQLVPSDDFISGIDEEQSFIINITDNLLLPPPFWKANYLHYYGGPYHWKKCKKYIEIAGVDGPNWIPVPYAAGDVYVKETRRWFEENPTYDEAGNRLYFENK